MNAHLISVDPRITDSNAKVHAKTITFIMSARKAKQNMKAGLQQMEGLMDSLMNEHLSKCI